MISDKQFKWSVNIIILLTLFLLIGCNNPPTCQNITIIKNITVEVPVDRLVEKIIYVNITQNISTANCTLYDKVMRNLIYKIDYYKQYIVDYINLSNCTDYIEFKDNQTRTVNLLANCTYDLRITNNSLNYCNNQLSKCINKPNE